MNLQRHIPHSKPTLGMEEQKVLAEVISSGHIAGGQQVSLFEQELAQYIGVSGAAAVSSGTAALHLSLLALGVGENDQIIVPTLTCTAILNAIYYVGAEPILADIDPIGYNLDPAAAKKALTRKTKAVIVPHMFGLPADLAGISALGVPVIEDCAQVIGATCQGRKAGSFGVLSVYSFYATKMMTTGEGGMVAGNSTDLLKIIRDLNRYDGKNRYKIRYNYKMTDLQAAMGRVQLRRLPEMIAKRKQIAQSYIDNLHNLNLGLPQSWADREHIFYRFVVQVPGDLDKIITNLKKAGIDCARPVFKPLHHYLRQTGFPQGQTVWETALSLPIYPGLTQEQLEYIIHQVKKIKGVSL